MRKNSLKPALAITALLALQACNNGGQPGVPSPMATSVQSTKPRVIPANRRLCFLQASGQAQTDTVRIQLNFNGDQVTGTMETVPYEKDARRGSLSGLLLQQEIKATWVYQQEGMQDSIALDFRLGNDELMQRPLITDPTTGRQRTDAQADFSIHYPEVDCR